MPAVNCTNCGRSSDLPEGYTRAKLRCPGCGYYTEIPPELRAGSNTSPESEQTPEKPNAALPTARRTAQSPAPAASPYDESKPVSGESYNPLSEESYSFTDPAPAKPKPPAKPPISKPVVVKPQRDPRDPRPNFDPDEPGGIPLLKGTQDDDDAPYSVPGTGLQKCKHCKCSLPLTAQFCVHCGRDIATGEKAKKVYQPIYREWGEGFALTTRFQILAGLQVVNVFVAIIAFLAQDLSFRDYGAIVANLIFGMIQLGLQAFLLGTFDTLQIERNAKGQTTLIRIRRIGFFAFPPAKLDWKQSCMVGTMGTHDPGIFAWMIFLYLLMLSCLPGLLFYWFVIRPERFTVNLTNEYGSSELVLFRTKDRDQAYEIAELISECTKLQLKRIL
jgi:hypothetical protein